MTQTTRPAAVAGSFYPESPVTLARDIERMLAHARSTATARPKAIIVPHAGYVYSGPVAASIYALLEGCRESDQRIERVVLLGPTHRVAVDGLAAPSSKAFMTPLGSVPIDVQAVASIAGLPQVVCSDAAHALEHSLEVQLPFLQAVLGDFSLVPLAVGRATAAEVADVLDRLWGGDETLIVISSDLSHYLPYHAAQHSDAETAEQILALDPTIDHQHACGATPVNGLLLAARRHGLHATLIDLRNSGDATGTAAGDKSRVVGYGAFAFSCHANADH